MTGGGPTRPPSSASGASAPADPRAWEQARTRMLRHGSIREDRLVGRDLFEPPQRWKRRPHVVVPDTFPVEWITGEAEPPRPGAPTPTWTTTVPNDRGMALFLASLDVLREKVARVNAVHLAIAKITETLATDASAYVSLRLSFAPASSPLPLAAGMMPLPDEAPLLPPPRPEPSWIAEFDQLVARAAHLRAVVRVRIRDQTWVTLMAALLGDPAEAVAEDEVEAVPRPERRVAMPDAPRLALPRETRAGPEGVVG